MIGRMLRRDSDALDAGFTLIEMVIAFLILGLIIAPLVSSYVLGLGETTATAQSVANSSDAQSLAAYFSGDVASANSFSTTNAAPTAACATGTILLQTQQTNLGSSTAVSQYFTYVAVENTSAESDLHLAQGLTPASVYEIDRIACDSAGTVTSKLTLARTIHGLPQVCDPSNVCPPPSTATELTITVSEYEFGSYSPPQLSGFYNYTLTGVRRVTS